MKRYTLLLPLLLFLLSCEKNTPDPPVEDFTKIFELKGADPVVQEPGVPFSCFPSKVGELGFVYHPEAYTHKGEDLYEVNITVEATTNTYNAALDPTNLSKLIIQYLDENNQLVTQELLDGSNTITSYETSYGTRYRGKDLYETYTIEKKSGDPVYFTVFYSPYGDFYLNVTAEVQLKEGNIDLPYLEYGYNVRTESFHITERGVEYFIGGKGMILP